MVKVKGDHAVMVDFGKLESDIEQKFVDWATGKELMPVKLNLIGRRGMPDRMILGHHGEMLFIEFKRPNGVVTKLQKHTQQILEGRGFKVFIVDSFEQAKTLCEKNLL